jgi:phosphoribosyl-ATP pyrophosphohydrolase
MMAGLDRERVARIVARSPVPVTVAGGITTLEDVRFLRDLGARGQVGMALYSGRLSLEDCLLANLDFSKTGLIPTVVQDHESADVLMLAYSSRESLLEALSKRRGIYYSRSRNTIWPKGETSGHTQELVAVDSDCDGDTLLFRVRQRGVACHFQRWSCFPRVERQFALADLDHTLADRQANGGEGSYTVSLLRDADLIAAKLREETEELIEAEAFADVRWEAADLLYFTLVAARAKGVALGDIVNELRSRHANP